MKKIVFILTFLFSVMLFSQNQGGIKGTITDKAMNNEPLLMANIQLKGDQVISQTNFHGNFEISDLSVGNYVLVISYLGYETIEIPVTIEENKVAHITADLSPLQINFGDIAGDVATASPDDIEFNSNTEKSPRK